MSVTRKMVASALLSVSSFGVKAQGGKPINFLLIWGDAIGPWNISAYIHGMLGYQLFNIDEVPAEGALFTVWYGALSCDAVRTAFITGQSLIRTGLIKLGLTGAPE